MISYAKMEKWAAGGALGQDENHGSEKQGLRSRLNQHIVKNDIARGSNGAPMGGNRQT